LVRGQDCCGERATTVKRHRLSGAIGAIGISQLFFPSTIAEWMGV
jgi:hypothetical protein